MIKNDTMSAETNQVKNKVTMFHDGECPLCKYEIKMMRKLDIKNAIHWIDISSDKEALDAAGISYKAAMARVHVRDENLKMKTGVRGFLLVWKQLPPYYRRIALIIEKISFLLPMLEAAYSLFAKYRLSLTGKKLKPEH